MFGLMLAGCSSTPMVDWNTRIGTYTSSQTVQELGRPDKSTKLDDGSVVAEWFLRHNVQADASNPVSAPGLYSPANGRARTRSTTPALQDAVSPVDFWIPDGKLKKFDTSRGEAADGVAFHAKKPCGLNPGHEHPGHVVGRNEAPAQTSVEGRFCVHEFLSRQREEEAWAGVRRRARWSRKCWTHLTAVNPRHGEIWLVDMGMTAKTRPGVVLIADNLNVPRSLIIHIPVARQNRQRTGSSPRTSPLS